MAAHVRIAALAVALAVAIGALGVALGWHEPLWSRLHRTTRPTAPTLVFVVIDTARADCLSACGYGRPTSPVLEALVRDGAELSCRAVAPGSWTLPSHASFFTGLPVDVHGADHVPAGPSEGGQVDVFGSGTPVRPLGDGPPTLAEELAARGYQTAAVSANVVVSDATGLLRGFQHRRAAGVRQWRGDELIGQVRATLRDDLRTDGTPLFLFVNVIDAHQPFAAVPEGLGWVPARERIDYHVPHDDPFDAYLTGALDEAGQADLRARVGDGYDYGLSRADAVLGGVLDALRDHGWMDDHRLVVVSDHGEFLGEHGLLDHGVYLWEPLTRVPLLLADSRGSPPELPDPVSAIEAHAWLRDGRLAGHPVVASAMPNPSWAALTNGRVGDVRSAATWGPGRTKHLWMNGATDRYDLESDPDELRPDAVQTPSALAELVVRAAARARTPVPVDAELVEMLESVGYLGGD